ncbi:MAG: endolytic transglycosylase MltG [Flavobacteriales bacterium]
MKLKWYVILASAAIVIAIASKIILYRQPQISEGIFIHERIETSDWIEKSGLNNIDKLSFRTVCLIRRITHLKAGRYLFRENQTTWDILSKLRSGNQDPLKVRVGNLQTLEDLCSVLGKQLKSDSTAFQNHFYSDTLALESCEHKCVACIIPPDDYEFYWTITPAQFIQKMIDTRNKFWNTDRLQRAQEIQMTPDEVCILASIVKAESGNMNEIHTIAGLYMNRLRIKMPLQSDPTVLFGKKAASQKRVSFSDLEIESPYNTYKRIGLPPGPICLVENQFLDAVLNYEKHNYLYMCALPSGVMAHTFSESYAEHVISAIAYRKWLDNNNIH